MKKDPNIVDADRSLVPGKPELRVNIDRKRAADLGVRVADIATTLNVMLAGTEVNTFTEGQERYDIRVRAQREYRRGPEALLDMTAPSSAGAPVPLRSVVTLAPGAGLVGGLVFNLIVGRN